MKKYLRYIPLFLFAAFVWGFSLLDILAPDKDFSPGENRMLKQYQPPTAETLLSGKFMTDYQDYVNDQFLLRDEWIFTKAFGESLLLKTENNDILFGKDNYLFAKETSYNKGRMKANLEYIMEFSENHPESPVYFSLIPSSSEVLKEYLPQGFPLKEQTPLIEECYQMASSSPLHIIDVGKALDQAAEIQEYLYFRTDHHWTDAGAQVAFDAFCKAVGKTPPPSEYPVGTVPNFYGTHYNKGKRIGVPADVITYTDYPIASITVDGESKPTLHHLEQFQEHDKYAGLVWGNNGVTVLQGEEHAPPNSRILIVKDSYGNTIIPKFLELYQEIVVVDLRFTSDITDVFQQGSFDAIYVLYSFPNFTGEDNIIKLVPEN